VQGWRRLIVILATLASRRKVVAFPPARPGFSCCNGDLNVDFGLFLLQKGILMWIWIVIMVTYIIFSHMHLLVRMGWACRDLHRDISSLNKAGAISPVEHLHRQTVISATAFNAAADFQFDVDKLLSATQCNNCQESTAPGTTLLGCHNHCYKPHYK
jgi:hypothetical protein